MPCAGVTILGEELQGESRGEYTRRYQYLIPLDNHTMSLSPSPATTAPLGSRPGKPARMSQSPRGVVSPFCNQKGMLITTLAQKKMHENYQSENAGASKATSSILLPSGKGPTFKPSLELAGNLNRTSKGRREGTAVPPDPRRRQGRYISPETGSAQSSGGTRDYSDSFTLALLASSSCAGQSYGKSTGKGDGKQGRLP